MRKRSIFLKIYLWFWLTTALITVAQFALHRLTDPHDLAFFIERDLTPVLLMYGHTALQHHLSGDDAGLTKWTAQLKTQMGLVGYLLDAKGQPVTGGPLPKEVQALAARVRQSGKPELTLLGFRAFLALPLKAEDGSVFYAVADKPERALIPYPPRRSIPFDLLRLLVVFAVSAGVCYGLARYLTAPIVRLRDATRRLASGELSARVGEKVGKRNDEYSEFAKDFDYMAARIESLMTQQRQLLGDISHELRSPLTRLKLALELARRHSGTGAATALNRIETEADLLEEMIAQVLTLTRLEGGIEGVNMASVDLTKLVAEIADDADFEAQARNCMVRLETENCTVQGNEELLRRAIENIVRNGVRCTRENTVVDVFLKLVKDNSASYAEISVRDHGPGVPESDIPHLVRPFYRVSTARERQTGGTGLGLAITERAVRLHNGSVKLSNAADGGFVAVIRLPLHSNPAASAC